MTIEIRELVIEARVVDDTVRDGRETAPPSAKELVSDRALIERIARRVLELLNEQRERL